MTHLGPNEQTTLSDAKKRATYSFNAVFDTKPSKFLPERVRNFGTSSLSSGNSVGNSALQWNFLHP